MLWHWHDIQTLFFSIKSLHAAFTVASLSVVMLITLSNIFNFFSSDKINCLILVLWCDFWKFLKPIISEWWSKFLSKKWAGRPRKYWDFLSFHKSVVNEIKSGLASSLIKFAITFLYLQLKTYLNITFKKIYDRSNKNKNCTLF